MQLGGLQAPTWPDGTVRGARAIFLPSNNSLPPETASVAAFSRAVDIARARDNEIMTVRADVAGRTADRVSFGSSAIADARGTVVRAGRDLSDDILVAEVHANGQDRAATSSGGSNRKPRMRAIAMKPYSIRGAKREEQRALTRLIVRATLHSGYDEAFIDRARPALAVSLNGIVTGNVQVAEQSGEVIGVVEVLSTVLQGIAVLGIFVDPAHWKKGVGRALFEAAIARARTLKVGALMIYASPFAEGFYRHLGAIRIGEGPFFYSPEVMLPHFLFIVPPAKGFVADKNST